VHQHLLGVIRMGLAQNNHLTIEGVLDRHRPRDGLQLSLQFLWDLLGHRLARGRCWLLRSRRTCFLLLFLLFQRSFPPML